MAAFENKPLHGYGGRREGCRLSRLHGWVAHCHKFQASDDKGAKGYTTSAWPHVCTRMSGGMLAAGIAGRQ